MADRFDPPTPSHSWPPPWWGSFTLNRGTITAWRLGPLMLYVERHLGEWRVAWERFEEDESPLDVLPPHPVVGEDLLRRDSVQRFALTAETDVLHLTPVLPDKPLVTRPERPFNTLPGEQVTVYVGMPLWVRIEAGEPRRLLCEVPIPKMNQTWFGPSTRHGELCYATKTYLRMELDQLKRRTWSAVTAVTLMNNADTPLALERLKLPTSRLSVSRGDDGRLWTEEVHLERAEEEGYAQLELRNRDWKRLRQGAERLSGPREPSPSNPLMRVFSSLFQ